MKLYKLLTLVLTAFAALTFASITTFAQVKVDNLTPDELNTVSQSYFRAAQAGNIRQMGQVLSPEFRFIDEQGQTLATAACASALEAAVSGPDTTQVFDRERIRVNSFNVKDVQTMTMGDMVIETMTYYDNITVQLRNTQDLVTFDRSLRWTNIWTQKEGTYKVVLTQLSPLDKGNELGSSSSREGTTSAQNSKGPGKAPACVRATASIGLLPMAVAALVVPSSMIAMRRRRKTKK